MKQQAASRSPQLTTEQQLYRLGYSRGYGEGYHVGFEVGEEDFRVWLRAELRDLTRDICLGLRHDLSPEETIAAVMEILKEGKPVQAADDTA